MVSVISHDGKFNLTPLGLLEDSLQASGSAEEEACPKSVLYSAESVF